MKKILLPVFYCLLSVICHLSPITCSAAIPTGYYSTIDGKKGDAICAALHEKIKGHTSLGYDNLYKMYQTSDMTSQGYIWDMYSTCNFDNPGDKCGSYKRVCDCFNREHSVPASWFGDANPMYCDPFHVIPTDGYVNNQRSNYALGECANGERLSGGSLCKLGTSTFEGYTGVGKVFEVDDQYKGDFARAYFYMVTCYRDKNFTQAGGGTTMFTWSNSKAGFTAYTIALMLKWHRGDPVSEKEIRRNDAIYTAQGNRNPFIDYPCLAEYIWGNYKNDELDMTTLMASSDESFFTSDRTGCNCQSDLPSLNSPKQSTTVDVGSASVGESVSQVIYIQGINLTQSLSLALSGTNAAYFSLNTSSVSASDALNGVYVSVSYKPQATTTTSHTATLTISSSELKSARTVSLRGECKAELVQPTTGTQFTFFAEGVGSTVEEKITVKGTNLTSGVYVGLASGSPASFSVTPTSLTAAQVNAGATVTVTYQPTKIGLESTKLILNSLGKEFSMPSITLSATCAFVVQDPTDITTSSATLHWVNAGTNRYMVDVFVLQQIEEKEVVILNSDKGTGASASSGTYNDVTGYVRLGTGSALGYISYSGLDLSKASTLTITAKSYKTDSDVKLKVSINSQDTIFSLTSSDAQYVVNLPEGGSQSSTIKLSSVSSGKRVLIKNVKLVTGGTKEQRDHVMGYPREENYLFHQVDQLLPETEYTYTVTPEGMPESAYHTFITTTPTDLDASSASCRQGTYKSVDAAGRLLLHCGQRTYSATGVQL